jgi:hypothetical protein
MKTTTPMGSQTGSHPGEPKKGTRNMKSILLISTSLMLASAAHAQGACWAYVEKDGKLICELRGPAPAASNYSTSEHASGQGPGTFSPSAYPSAPTTITSRSTISIRSYRR